MAPRDLRSRYMIDGFGKIVYADRLPTCCLCSFFCKPLRAAKLEDDFTAGLADLVQSSGMGAFEPNCILAAWPKNALGDDVQSRIKLATSPASRASSLEP